MDDHELTELAAFVNALYRLGGYKSAASWAREADYPQTNLSDLRNAKSGVDGYNLLKLLRAVAKRLDERPVDVALAAARNVELDDAPSRAELARDQAKVAARLEELAGLIADALAHLAGGTEPESERPPGEEPRAT